MADGDLTIARGKILAYHVEIVAVGWAACWVQLALQSTKVLNARSPDWQPRRLDRLGAWVTPDVLHHLAPL